MIYIGHHSSVNFHSIETPAIQVEGALYNSSATLTEMFRISSCIGPHKCRNTCPASRASDPCTATSPLRQPDRTDTTGGKFLSLAGLGIQDLQH